jgi:hypothetical protein
LYHYKCTLNLITNYSNGIVMKTDFRHTTWSTINENYMYYVTINKNDVFVLEKKKKRYLYISMGIN